MFEFEKRSILTSNEKVVQMTKHDLADANLSLDVNLSPPWVKIIILNLGNQSIWEFGQSNSENNHYRDASCITLQDEELINFSVPNGYQDKL